MFEGIGKIGAYVNAQKMQNQFNRKVQDGFPGQKLGTGRVVEHKSLFDAFEDGDRRSEWRSSAVINKLEGGEKLTRSDLEYLRKHHPSLYSKAAKVAMEREAFEKKLKSCKTKEEARQARMSAAQYAMSSLSASSAEGAQDTSGSVWSSRSFEKAWHGFSGSKKFAALAESPQEVQNRMKKARRDSISVRI